MFRDELRCEVWNEVQARGIRAFATFLTPKVFKEAARRTGKSIISSPLNLVNLVWLGLACALDTGKSFASVLTMTFKILDDAPGALPPPVKAKPRGGEPQPGKRAKHDPRRDDPTKVTEEAFVQARARMPLSYWLAVIFLVADNFAHQHEDMIRWKHFRLLALDGTLINLPRWNALAKHYGVAKGVRGGRTPQARLVMLQFPLARIPYRYALGSKNEAEKTLAESLLDDLCKNDLLLMDRGFWSYGLFHRIVEKNAYFAIREIAQAHLKLIKNLGRDDTLVQYAPTAPKWRKLGLPEEMILRRIAYQIPGFRPSAVLTNVLDPKVISASEWVGMTTRQAGQTLHQTLYHYRWQIETTFSELKVFQELKELRGRTPGSIRYEISGHILLYLLVRLLMVEAAKKHGVDPLRLSFTAALGEIANIGWAVVTSSRRRVRQVLIPRLLDRIADHKVPPRPGRSYPRPNDTKTRDIGYGQKKKPAKLVA